MAVSRYTTRYNNYIVLVLGLLTFVFILHQQMTADINCLSGPTQNALCRAYTASRAKVNVDLTRPQSAIPKRLHQTFKNEMIPLQYVKHMQTWIRNHPDWEFFFWTDASAAQMIKERYPRYLELFQKYDHPLTKSDAIRYFILHQFGGIYADLDVLSIKPIEPFIRTNTCILVPEPTVQTNLIFNLDQSLTNCIMAGVAKHPFLDYVLESLPNSYRKIEHNHDVLHSTGPFFLNKTYSEYNAKYKRCKKDDAYCQVFVADHKNLVPRIDVPDLKHNVQHICPQRGIGKLQQRACERLKETNFANDLPPEAYTDHLWLHLGWDHEKMKKVFKTKHIFEINPNVITYEMIKGSGN